MTVKELYEKNNIITFDMIFIKNKVVKNKN